MSPVPLNHMITIRQRQPGVDGLGQPLEVWTDVCSVWSDVRHLAGLQHLAAGADVSIVRSSIRIRARTDITAAMRVHYGAAVYDIRAVLADPASRGHQFLVCELIQ